MRIMELKEAYEQLKDLYDEFESARFSELKAKPNAKHHFHQEANKVKEKVWRVFEFCPILYEYVPYEDEFFTSYFERDFKTLMNTLNKMNLV